MKAEELRIGNLVHYNGIHKETGTVTGIMTYATGHQNISINYRRDISYSINELQPIELTEEWLLKFGFELKLGNYELPDFRFHINKPINYDGFLFCEGYSVITDKIHYVHQIQNLYFTLTTQELTLTK